MKKKRLIITGFVVVVLAGIAAAALLWQPRSQIESMALEFLRGKGIEDARLEVSAFSTDAMEIKNIIVGDALSIDTVRVTYDWQQALSGRVRAIEIGTVTLRLAYKEGNASAGGLEKLMGGDGGQGATTINFPFDSVTVSKLDVSLATDASTQQAVMEGVQFTHENGQAKLNVATIAQIAEKPALKPVSLTMDIELGAPVTWKGQLQTPDAKLRVPLDGSWDGAKKRLIANALLEPLNFETGMLQPEDVFPLMRGMLLQTQGKIKGKASFACAPECKQSASLTLDAFSTTMGGARMKDASGTIVLKQFYPPLTDGKQTIRIKRLEAGVPLEEGLVQFSLTPDGKVVLEPMKWSWVKGALVTDRIVLTPGSLEGQKVKLHVRHIDLQSLLSLLMKEGMTATGMLDGTIPVQYSKGRLILDNATLGAVGKGTLNYNPASGSPLAGNSQTELLGEALKNFHYELMSLAISSGEDGNAKVAMQLKGANPELYDGKPIELNITLQGHLQDIITQSMDAYSLPEQIGKQYQEKKP